MYEDSGRVAGNGYAPAGAAAANPRRRRRTEARSPSVVPPQIPATGPLAVAQAKQEARTGQRRQTAFAAFTCRPDASPVPIGKNNSGSWLRQAASLRHSIGIRPSSRTGSDVRIFAALLLPVTLFTRAGPALQPRTGGFTRQGRCAPHGGLKNHCSPCRISVAGIRQTRRQRGRRRQGGSRSHPLISGWPRRARGLGRPGLTPHALSEESPTPGSDRAARAVRRSA